MDIIKEAINKLDADIAHYKRGPKLLAVLQARCDKAVTEMISARNQLAAILTDVPPPALRGSGRTMSEAARRNMRKGQRKRWLEFYKNKNNGKG